MSGCARTLFGAPAPPGFEGAAEGVAAAGMSSPASGEGPFNADRAPAAGGAPPASPECIVISDSDDGDDAGGSGDIQLTPASTPPAAAPGPIGPSCAPVNAALASLLDELDAAHAVVVAAAPGDTEAAAARAEVLARLGVTDSPGRPNFNAQVDAVRAALRSLLLGGGPGRSAPADRGNIIMPCGSGKSLVSLWTTVAFERFAGARVVLILVPSLFLVAQLLHTYGAAPSGDSSAATLGEAWEWLVVCSDRSVGDCGGAAALPPSQDSEDGDQDLPAAALRAAAPHARICTAGVALADLLGAPLAVDKALRVVIATYRSVPRIEAAQHDLRERGTPHAFALGIFDEAHHTAVGADQLSSYALDNVRVAIEKRLFLTATPRVRRVPAAAAGSTAAGAADGDDEPPQLFSMDDEKLYGRTLYALSLREAIRAHMLCTYKIVLAGFRLPTDAEHQRWGQLLGEPDISALELGKLRALVGALGALYGRAGGAYDARKAVAFSSMLSDANALAARLAKLDDCGDDGQQIDAWFVPGEMPMADRAQRLDALRDSNAPAGVLCNVRALQEGVDAPWCDTAAFMSACANARMVAQAVGRVLRLHVAADGRAKSAAFIILPVLEGEYEPLVAFITALASVDDELAKLLHMLGAALHSEAASDALQPALQRATDGLFEHVGVDVRDAAFAHLQARLAEGFDRLTYGGMVAHLAAHPQDKSFSTLLDSTSAGMALNKLRAAVAKAAAAQRPLPAAKAARVALLSAAFPDLDWTPRCRAKWDTKFDELVQFRAEHGHVDVPSTREGPGSLYSLYNWTNKQRTLYAADPAAYTRSGRYARLDALGFWAVRDKWLETCRQLHSYAAAHGGAVPAELKDWAYKQRANYGKGKLRDERVALLEKVPGWSWEIASTRKRPHEPDAGDGCEADAEEDEVAGDSARPSQEQPPPPAPPPPAPLPPAPLPHAPTAHDSEAPAGASEEEEEDLMPASLLSAAHALTDMTPVTRADLAPEDRDELCPRSAADAARGARWDADGEATLNGDPAAHMRPASLARALAAARACARKLAAVLKREREALRAAEKQHLYFMPHTNFTRAVCWARELSAVDAACLFPPSLAGAAVPYRVLTFGVAADPLTRMYFEFNIDVPAALGYVFRKRDAVVVPWRGGADVDGRDVETRLKALLKASYKTHAAGVATRAALGAQGVVPFDHPACATPDAAPPGIKDETVLVAERVWRRLAAASCTEQLAAWVDELQHAVDAGVAAALAALPPLEA